MMRMERFQLPNGANLSYAEYGTPDGRPVLLFHGLIGSVASEGMDSLLDPLPFRVIAMARPGYGASDYFEMDCVADWGRQMKPLLDRLGLWDFDVLGLSAGAPYAYSLAALYPERVGAVYINSGIPAVYLPEVLAQYPAEDAALYERFRRGTREETGRELYESCAPLFPESARQGLDFRDSMGGDLRNIGQEAKLQCIPWGFELAGVRCPAVLIHGTADSEVPYGAMAVTAGYLPDPRIVTLEGEEHVSPLMTERVVEEMLRGSRGKRGESRPLPRRDFKDR